MQPQVLFICKRGLETRVRFSYDLSKKIGQQSMKLQAQHKGGKRRKMDDLKS
jgi:hypothetical protein